MFKISEFARIARVSSHTLRHYDEIKLFQPQHIDRMTGYRYYSVEQLPRIHQIMALRELGLSLDQIKSMLHDNIQDCEIRGMLMLRRQEVIEQIEREHLRLNRIDARLAQLELEEESTRYDIVIKNAPESVYLTTGHITVSDREIAEMMLEIYHTLKHETDHDIGFGLIVVRDNPTPEGLSNIEAGYPLQKPHPGELVTASGYRLHTRTLNACPELATVIHSGARRYNERAYKAVFEWMAANEYHFMTGAFAREIYLKPGRDADDHDNIVEIQIPISKEEPLN